ncbi:MAG TPA: spore germination protein GerW family protein [Candidatus Aquicultor sp.]|jgi:uncharacterized spore protein YtfJ
MTEFGEVADKIIKQLGATNVEMIFGESRQIGDKVVIPVGKIQYGWGGGGGRGAACGKKGEEATGQQPEGEGQGMGMGVVVKPLGYITVTSDRVTYEPIIDFSPVLMIMAPLLGLALLKFFGSMKHMAKGGCRCGKCISMWNKGFPMAKFMHHKGHSHRAKGWHEHK